MATKYFLFTGMIDPIHPAGVIIFCGAVLTALLARKGFCSWICPVGTLSEYAWRMGRRLTRGRDIRLPVYADYTLMSVKYLVMGAFFFVIGIAMSPTMILLFMISDYYMSADVRMLLFFLDPTALAASVLLVLVAASFFIKNFWCRYLCPYGAFLGLLAYASPMKISRDPETCTDCRTCTRNCPALIDVASRTRVTSPECTGCLTCVSHCPEEGALEVAVRTKGKARPVRPPVFAAVLLTVFFGLVGLGMATGNWQSRLPEKEYARLIPMLATPELRKQPHSLSGSSSKSEPSKSSP
jgi:polyferredoxin